MSDENPIKKPKEKQIRKTQSSSHFFKESSKHNKKKSQLSHVEVGLPDPIEEQQKVLGRPTPCTVLAVSTTLFILIVLIISLGELGLHDKSAFEWVKPPNKTLRRQDELPCETIECVKYSAELLEAMSPEVNPCDDFHKHVCYGFTPEKRNPDRLLKIVKTPSDSEHNKTARVVRNLLSKCALEESKERNHNERLGTIISFSLPFPILSINWTTDPDDFSMLPNVTDVPNSTYIHHVLTDILIHTSRHTPEDAGLFGVTPSTDSEFSMFVVKPNSPSLSLYQLRNVVDVLKRHIPDEMMNSTKLSEAEIEKQLERVIELQDKLEDIICEAHPEIVQLDTIQKQMSNIDWNRLIESWYPTNGNKTMLGKVYGFNTTYYEKVNELLTKTSSETLYNFLFLRFSFGFLRSELSSDLVETCLLQVSQTIPGRIILHGSAEPGARELFEEMRKTIKAHMRNSLSKLQWMDSSGIEVALTKLDKTTTVYGFSGEELIDELNITTNSSYAAAMVNVLEWQAKNMFKSIAENSVSIFLKSEVFYCVERNEITISRSLLHYPFISTRLPSYTNFATVASRIIPQLIHIFDERGRFYNSNGVAKDWWNSKTEEHFRVVVKCFDSFMQDVFGVSISLGWSSYDSTNEPYAILPGLNKTDSSLFFYSLVKTMCNSDPVKVNKGLASVPQFNSAFNCQRNAAMNPKTKCKMAA